MPQASGGGLGVPAKGPAFTVLKSPSCQGPSRLPTLWLLEIYQHQGSVRPRIVERASDLECCLLMTVNRSVVWNLPGIRDFLLINQEGDVGKWILQSDVAL